MVNKFAIITGSGAVGFPEIPKIKSGNARNPIMTNRRNESLLSADKSLIDNDPKIRHIMPIITELRTKAKVSNINIASLLISEPNVSASSIVFISIEIIDKINGATWNNRSKVTIKKIVLILTFKFKKKIPNEIRFYVN